MVVLVARGCWDLCRPRGLFVVTVRRQDLPPPMVGDPTEDAVHAKRPGHGGRRGRQQQAGPAAVLQDIPHLLRHRQPPATPAARYTQPASSLERHEVQMRRVVARVRNKARAAETLAVHGIPTPRTLLWDNL